MIRGLILFTICVSCTFIDRGSKVKFVNDSDLSIDSIIFRINNYKLKLGETARGTTVTKEVQIDSIKLNNHDVTIVATIYDNGTEFKGAFFYNDLKGSLDEEYTLTLRKDLTTILK